MADIELIQSEYYRMRGIGMDAKAALTKLRAEIIELDLGQRERLLETLRIWEISNAAASVKANPAPRPPTQVGQIKPLQTATVPKADDPFPAPSSPTANTPGKDKVPCPTCGSMNAKDEVFCYACGGLMKVDRGIFDTRHFTSELDEFTHDEVFGPDTTLVLVIKGTQDVFKLRPQEVDHDLIVGRSDGGTMQPDVDLSPHDGGSLGVSRMHLTLHYNDKHRTISATDMGSANGTTINGQKLRPEEVRVLRHGDELRLGKMGMVVYFYRGKGK